MNGDLSIDCNGVTPSDGIISGATIEGNLIYDNGTGGGSGINCDGVRGSTIVNNLIYDAHASGISLYQIDAGGPSIDNRVIYNTVVMASDGRWALNIRDASTGNFVRNNIFLTFHSFRGSIVITDDSRAGFSSDFNVVTARLSPDGDATILALAGWQALGYDASSVSASPAAVFVDVMADDYHLAAGSPAIDAATTSFPAPATDREGNARPAGAAPDIGAHERGGAPAADGGVTDQDAGLRTDGGGSGGGAPRDGGASDGGAAARDARSNVDGGSTGTSGDGGCSCRAAGTGRPGSMWWLLAPLALVLAARRAP